MKELLDAIVASPDDDAPRRVYADALLDEGELLGELIHVQLDLAAGGLSREGGIARRRRERELLRAHRERWWAPVQSITGRPPLVRRGFVEHVMIDAGIFPTKAEALFAAAPLLRTVTLDELIGFRGDWTTEEPDVPAEGILAKFAAALDSPFVSRLHGLHAWVGMQVERDGLYGMYRYFEAIWAAMPILAAAVPRLPHLRELRLGACPTEELTSSGILAQLEYLDVHDFEEQSLTHILDAAPRLRSLRLPELKEHIGVLAHPRIAQLEELGVKFADGVGDAAARAMSQPALAKLRRLMCDAGDDNAAIIRAIADSPHLANLVALDVSETQFTSLRPLATATRLDALRELKMFHNIMEEKVDADVRRQEIARWPLLQRLELLDSRIDVPGFDGLQGL